MNLWRSLSRHQLYYLQEVASGHLVILIEDGEWFERVTGKAGATYDYGLRETKPRGKHLMKAGNHKSSSIAELRQRGLLVEVDGRVVPSPAAVKQFGAPPPLKSAERRVVMNRTRPARVQDVNEVKDMEETEQS